MELNTLVFQTLSGCLDPNPNVRLESELKLKNFTLNPEYSVILLNIALAQELPFAQRQLAAITLKSLVGTHWTQKDEKFVGPEIPESSKSIIRSQIISGLSDNLNKIRVALAYVISKIAQYDWPESWPTLFDSLLENLRSGESKQVHGAMRVLSEFIRSDITDQQFPIVAPLLFPELFKIFNEKQLYSAQTRSRAVSIMIDFIEMLNTVKVEHPDAAKYYLGPIINDWMVNILSYLENSPNKEYSEYGLRLEVITMICKLIETFPKMVIQYIPSFLPIIWNHLSQLSQRYVNEVVNDDNGEFAEEHSDGETLGMDTFLFILFEFFNLLASNRHYKSIFTSQNKKRNEKKYFNLPENHNPQQFIEELVYTCLIYMQMTQEQMDTWTSDVNQYVQDEQDETYSYNVRISAQELIVDCLAAFYPFETINAIINASQRHFENGIRARANEDPNWWKIHESCLLVIGRCSSTIIEGVKQQQIQFDLGSLFNHVILEDIGFSDLPFLQGRTLWFSSQFAQSLPPQVATQYITAAVNALQQNQPFPVKISSVKALKSFCTYLDNEKLKPFQTSIIENMAPMIASATEDILFLILETFTDIIKINPETTAQYEPIITPIVIDVWIKNCEDPLMSSFVNDLFEILAPNPGFKEPLQNKVIPVVMQSLLETKSETFSGVATSCLELITVLIKKSTEPLPPLYIQQIFPNMIQLLSNTDDHSVLQSGQDYLKFMVQKALPQLMEWVDPSCGKNGFVIIVEFIAKMLDPSQSDNSSIFLGDLINKIILKAGNDIVQILPDLLTAITKRVATSKNTMFIQSMISVYAQLIQTQIDSVISFLNSINIDNQSCLSIILKAWCENFDSFQGAYKTKLCTVALSKLFAYSDQNLQNVLVQGDLIITENKGIMTRSKSKAAPKQYTTIPFCVKAIKLLIAEYQRSLEDELIIDNQLTEEDDEEWEDDDGFNDNQLGEFTYLSDIIEYGNLEGEGYEEEDEDIKNDPINQIKTTEYLTDFFKKCAEQNINNFIEICGQYLEPPEQKLVHNIINKN